jgi:hypothetical protein
MAALDERLTKSAPIAGTVPIVCSASVEMPRDWEQYLPFLNIEYGDLYAMGITTNRKQTQYLNANEGTLTNGFNRTIYNVAPYSTQMASITDRFAIDWDEVTQTHEITAATLAKMITFFNS